MMALRLNEIVRTVRGRLARDECATASDAALLERFRNSRDEEAFAELVRRHGPMVLGVCRRLLRNADDADDAFQATFLVLVRRESAVRQLSSVGSWLYGVARRTALEARRAAARRRVKEAGAMRGSTVAGDPCDDLRDALDEEIERLPEKYRAPLVLCDLEGKTRKEAARHLGWPEGTVASRLALARKTLRGRLSRRGLALPGGVLAVVATSEEGSAAVSPTLVGSTVRAATGRALVSSGVSALVKGVLTNMLLKKLKTGLLVTAVVGVVAAGGNIFHGGFGMVARAADDGKPRSALEELRHENELLKTNLHVLLEKVHAQETELAALQTRFVTADHVHDLQAEQFTIVGPGRMQLKLKDGKEEAKRRDASQPAPKTEATSAGIQGGVTVDVLGASVNPKGPEGTKPTLQGFVFVADAPLLRAEEAMKTLREARDEKARKQAIQQLEAALAIMKSHHGE